MNRSGNSYTEGKRKGEERGFHSYGEDYNEPRGGVKGVLVSLEKIWAPVAGALQGHFVTPGVDRRVIPTEEDIRNAFALPFLGAGVLGEVEEPGTETFLLNTAFATDYAGSRSPT